MKSAAAPRRSNNRHGAGMSDAVAPQRKLRPAPRYRRPAGAPAEPKQRDGDRPSGARKTVRCCGASTLRVALGVLTACVFVSLLALEAAHMQALPQSMPAWARRAASETGGLASTALHGSEERSVQSDSTRHGGAGGGHADGDAATAQTSALHPAVLACPNLSSAGPNAPCLPRHFVFVGGLQRSGTSSLAALLLSLQGVSGLRFDVGSAAHLRRAPWKSIVDVHTGAPRVSLHGFKLVAVVAFGDAP